MADDDLWQTFPVIPRCKPFDDETEATRITPFSAAYPWQFKSVFPWGWTIGKGWLLEVQQVVEYVDQTITDPVDRAIFSWLQVKQKFGRLEMYCRVSLDLSPDLMFMDERHAYDGWEALKAMAGDRLVIEGEKANFRIPSLCAQQIFDRVQEARRKCESICEVCGQPGTLIQQNWHRVRCEQHFHEG